MIKKLLLLVLFTNINSYSVSFKVHNAFYDNATPFNRQTPKSTVRVFEQLKTDDFLYVTDEKLFFSDKI
ncbi:hypothetical protein IPH25_03120 [bacterium]|nr:MAG: hypothetical protein IPG37_00110 [bacterium]QQR61458.1 MAG: hypothetical protein IPH25_03120 [bacterium]QQR63016.1 MAG: hypothetical protein IPH67_00890 [bacterium]